MLLLDDDDGGGGVAILRPAVDVRVADGDAARHGRDILKRGRTSVSSVIVPMDDDNDAAAHWQCYQ